MLPPLPTTSRKFGPSFIAAASVRGILATLSIRAFLRGRPGNWFSRRNPSKHNFTYRIYGEMLDLTWCSDERVSSPREGTPSPASAVCPSAEIKKGEQLPSNVGDPRGGPSPSGRGQSPRLKNARPSKEAQRDHIDPLYPDFAIDYPDQLRADEFLREFDEFGRARGSAKELPSSSISICLTTTPAAPALAGPPHKLRLRITTLRSGA